MSECDNFTDLGRTIELHAEGPVPYTCRPDALARAVRNLIENATKYAGSAEVRLLTGPDGVEIVVADRGPGIPEDEALRVREPFERVSPAREPDQDGFGLGLAIVSAICAGHDGELTLEANRPTGCIATVRLPLERPADGD